MTDEAYTNLDLDTADELLIAAGRPELAKALRYQTQGVRNLVQGEWGRSFVNTLDNIMETRVVNVLASVQLRLDQQIELVQQILTAVREAQNTARQALSVSEAGQRGLKKANVRIGKVEKRVSALEDNNTRLDVLEATIAARPALREAEYRAIAERAAEEAIRRLEARGDGNG
jgi:hypothetical protein